jgi:hypothetical protein
MFNVKSNITEGEDGGGVIKKSHEGREGALIVIAWVSEEALVGASLEFGLEGMKDLLH